MDPRLEKYAKLLINVGIHVQKGQTLVINASVDSAPFVRLCAAESYKLGCREVIIRWNDEFLTREKYLHAADEVFDAVRPWDADMMNTLAREGAAFLSIVSRNPDAMKGVDTDRMRRYNRAYGEAVAEFEERQMSDKVQWCIACVPSTAWAMKVFPGAGPEEAAGKLWDAIYATMHITAENDPVEEWRRHCEAIIERKNKLTAYNFKYLKYKNSLGTDLTIELPEGHYWEGGSSTSADGVSFIANMPTEEIFTAPKLDGVNGVVHATKPLLVSGQIIENFSFTFEKGKIVKVEAPENADILEAETKIDEGASYLGEVALVPYDSPISKMGILFFNTLFDENASCHLAFGASYPTVRGAADMTKEERLKLGLNDSIAHEDFMVGSADLSIVGVTHEGEEIPVFIDGNFAF